MLKDLKSYHQVLEAKLADQGLVDRHTAAALMGKNIRTLQRWHRAGRGPKRVPGRDHLGVLYLRSEVEQWKLAEQTSAIGGHLTDEQQDVPTSAIGGHLTDEQQDVPTSAIGGHLTDEQQDVPTSAIGGHLTDEQQDVPTSAIGGHLTDE